MRQQRDTTRLTDVLLASGILSSIWYVVINAAVPSLWPEYSIVDQTVSELSAFGAPTRAVWIVAALPYTILFGLFGWGVLRTGTADRRRRTAGWLILACAVLNLWWPPMHAREVLAAGGGTMSDTLHLVWAGAITTMFIMIMVATAASLGSGLRLYTAFTVVVLAVFGGMTTWLSPNVALDLPTPWIGVWERLNIGAFLLWVVVVAVALLNRGDIARTPLPEVGGRAISSRSRSPG